MCSLNGCPTFLHYLERGQLKGVLNRQRCQSNTSVTTVLHELHKCNFTDYSMIKILDAQKSHLKSKTMIYYTRSTLIHKYNFFLYKYELSNFSINGCLLWRSDCMYAWMIIQSRQSLHIFNWILWCFWLFYKLNCILPFNKKHNLLKSAQPWW